MLSRFKTLFFIVFIGSIVPFFHGAHGAIRPRRFPNQGFRLPTNFEDVRAQKLKDYPIGSSHVFSYYDIRLNQVNSVRGTVIDVVEDSDPSRFAVRLNLLGSKKEVTIPGSGLLMNNPLHDYEKVKSRYEVEDTLKVFVFKTSNEISGSVFQASNDLLFRVGSIQALNHHHTTRDLVLSVKPSDPLSKLFNINHLQLNGIKSIDEFPKYSRTHLLNKWGVLRYRQPNGSIKELATQITAVKKDSDGKGLYFTYLTTPKNPSESADEDLPTMIHTEELVSFHAFDFEFGKVGLLHFKQENSVWTQKTAVLKGVDRDTITNVVGVYVSFYDDQDSTHFIPLTDIKRFKLLELPLDTLGIFYTSIPPEKWQSTGVEFPATGDSLGLKIIGKALDVVRNPAGRLEVVVDASNGKAPPMHLPLNKFFYFSEEELPKFDRVGTLIFLDRDGNKKIKITKITRYDYEKRNFILSHAGEDGLPLEISLNQFVEFKVFSVTERFGIGWGKWAFQDDKGTPKTVVGQFLGIEENEWGILCLKINVLDMNGGRELAPSLIPAWHLVSFNRLLSSNFNHQWLEKVGFLTYLDSSGEDQKILTKLLDFDESRRLLTVSMKDSEGNYKVIPEYLILEFKPFDTFSAFTFIDEDQKEGVYLGQVLGVEDSPDGTLQIVLETYKDRLAKNETPLKIPASSLKLYKTLSSMKDLNNNEYGILTFHIRKDGKAEKVAYACKVAEALMSNGKVILRITYSEVDNESSWVPLEDVLSFESFP